MRLPSDATTVLIAEADAESRRAMTRMLALAGFAAEACDRASRALQHLSEDVYAAAVVDVDLKVDGGGSLLEAIRQRVADLGVIGLANAGDMAAAVSAMRLGAYDCLARPVDGERLVLSVQHLMEHQNLLTENRALRARLTSTVAFGEIVRLHEGKQLLDLSEVHQALR